MASQKRPGFSSPLASRSAMRSACLLMVCTVPYLLAFGVAASDFFDFVGLDDTAFSAFSLAAATAAAFFWACSSIAACFFAARSAASCSCFSRSAWALASISACLALSAAFLASMAASCADCSAARSSSRSAVIPVVGKIDSAPNPTAERDTVIGAICRTSMAGGLMRRAMPLVTSESMSDQRRGGLRRVRERRGEIARKSRKFPTPCLPACRVHAVCSLCTATVIWTGWLLESVECKQEPFIWSARASTIETFPFKI
mmetsp:Transcript_6622/g.17212  ORF Transcript_6622/g.17212 Transcript_6622/m.17212 type:complete len:258 (-) Transcript_6622:12-785(-)